MLLHIYLPSSSSLVFRTTLCYLEDTVYQLLLQLVVAHELQVDIQGSHWEEANYSRTPPVP